MAQARQDGPNFWVTPLTRPLVGEDACEWSACFRAHHQNATWQQEPGDFDRVGWQMAQTAGVIAAREKWDESGHTVFTEKQNIFPLRGELEILGGRPDLIGRRDESGVVGDVKTGTRHPSQVVQVMAYMYAVPRCIETHRDTAFQGQAGCADGVMDILVEAVGGEFIRRLSRLLWQLRDSRPTRRVSSLVECAYCPITTADRPGRLSDAGIGEGAASDFPGQSTFRPREDNRRRTWFTKTATKRPCMQPRPASSSTRPARRWPAGISVRPLRWAGAQPPIWPGPWPWHRAGSTNAPAASTG